MKKIMPFLIKLTNLCISIPVRSLTRKPEFLIKTRHDRIGKMLVSKGSIMKAFQMLQNHRTREKLFDSDAIPLFVRVRMDD